ncbi:hypothetical protein M0802_006746 [Mischocyttarus mexicanus]|nr:hypothetical protein M0802_006746 [Mischocyttarus mexicanus]
MGTYLSNCNGNGSSSSSSSSSSNSNNNVRDRGRVLVYTYGLGGRYGALDNDPIYCYILAKLTSSGPAYLPPVTPLPLRRGLSRQVHQPKCHSAYLRPVPSEVE